MGELSYTASLCHGREKEFKVIIGYNVSYSLYYETLQQFAFYVNIANLFKIEIAVFCYPEEVTKCNRAPTVTTLVGDMEDEVKVFEDDFSQIQAPQFNKYNKTLNNGVRTPTRYFVRCLVGFLIVIKPCIRMLFQSIAD